MTGNELRRQNLAAAQPIRGAEAAAVIFWLRSQDCCVVTAKIRP
jgi:hypothetical protein